jgi:hypothetical protein
VVARNHQKSAVWFFLLCGYCAFRAALPLTVAMAYLVVICRIVQLIGAALKKRVVAKVAYVLATVFMFVMWFTVMADQSHLISFY